MSQKGYKRARHRGKHFLKCFWHYFCVKS